MKILLTLPLLALLGVTLIDCSLPNDVAPCEPMYGCIRKRDSNGVVEKRETVEQGVAGKKDADAKEKRAAQYGFLKGDLDNVKACIARTMKQRTKKHMKTIIEECRRRHGLKRAVNEIVEKREAFEEPASNCTCEKGVCEVCFIVQCFKVPECPPQ